MKLLITVGPSCSGKSTLISELEKRGIVRFIPSYTTRVMRADESDGKPYYFVSKAEFEAMIDKGEFIEWTENHEHLYGKRKSSFKETTSICSVDIDSKGIYNYLAEFGRENVFVLYVTADDDVLRTRMLKRDGEVSSLRMKNGEKEHRFYISHGSAFDGYINTSKLTISEVVDRALELMKPLLI